MKEATLKEKQYNIYITIYGDKTSSYLCFANKRNLVIISSTLLNFNNIFKCIMFTKYMWSILYEEHLVAVYIMQLEENTWCSIQLYKNTVKIGYKQ